MASRIPILDIQEDSLRLLWKGSCYTHRKSKTTPCTQGRIADPDGLATEIRRLFRENKIPLRRVSLMLPRQQTAADFRPLLKKAGLSPAWAIPKDLALRALLPERESACLLIPEENHFQAVFFHRGACLLSRRVDDPQALTQILQIYRFSNPDAPISRIYLPRKLTLQLGDGWEVLPLEDLLPEGIPPEAVAVFGGSRVPETDTISFPPDLSPRQIALGIGFGAALLLFLCVGIFRPLHQRKLAREELARQQTLAQQLDDRLEEYAELYDAYLRTGGGVLTDSELSLADRVAVLDLTDQVICPRANVTEFTLSGNSLTLHLTGISLENAGALVSELSRHPLVSQAQLHSVEADSGKASSIYLRITLEDAGKEEPS